MSSTRGGALLVPYWWRAQDEAAPTLLQWARSRKIESTRAFDRETLTSFVESTRQITSENVSFKVCAIVGLFLQHVVAEFQQERIPFEIVRSKRPKAEVHVFHTEDVRRIQEVARNENDRDRAVFMLFVDTAIRAGEILRTL